jgi:hypothetical protein
MGRALLLSRWFPTARAETVPDATARAAANRGSEKAPLLLGAAVSEM